MSSARNDYRINVDQSVVFLPLLNNPLSVASGAVCAGTLPVVLGGGGLRRPALVPVSARVSVARTLASCCSLTLHTTNVVHTLDGDCR